MGMTFMIGFFGITTAKAIFAGMLLAPVVSIAAMEFFR